MSENPKGIWNPVWPSLRMAVLRVLLIVAILLPMEWAIFALLVGDWKLEISDWSEETRRHLIEGSVIFAGAVSVIFLASLLPVFGRIYRMLGWCFSARNIRRAFILLIWLVTISALFYAEEDWRGSKNWSNYRQKLEADGAQLDYAQFIPKNIPDEQNFAAIPVVKSWFVEVDPKVRTNTTFRFTQNWNDNYEKVMNKFTKPPDTSDRSFTDLVAWEMAFSAIRSGLTLSNQEFHSGKLDAESRRDAVPVVIEGLRTNETALAELQAGSPRPLARYPVIYDLENPWAIYLPHLVNVRNACRRLQLRACSELAAGDSNAALADVKLMLYLADTVKDEPFLISLLVRLACVQMSMQPVWEGLATHSWSDDQLQALETRLQQFDFIRDLKWPFESERAVMVLEVDLIRKKGLAELIELMGPGQPTSMDKKFANWWSGMIPSGWYELEKINCCKAYEIQIDGTFDPAKKRVFPDQIQSNSAILGRELPAKSFGNTVWQILRHRVIASAIAPSSLQIPVKCAMAQTASDEAAIACALERFRLAKGKYPENLDELEPQHISKLPTEVINGEPFRYRKTGNGKFVLYSVGWNEKDDGGTPGKNLFDDKEGDWVWQYPGN